MLGIWEKSSFSLKVNVKIFFARRELKWKIKASKTQRCLVYIPTYSPTQHVSFDTTNQFQERWSGEELMKFKHFSDVYSNSLDLLIGSIALCQSQRDGFVFISPPTFVTYLCWKTGRCSCLLGTQDVIQAAQYLAITNWQPLNCHSSKRLNLPRLNKTCQSKQAGVSADILKVMQHGNHRQILYEEALWPYRDLHTPLLYVHTYTHSHIPTHSTVYTYTLPMQQWLQKEQGDKTKWIADTSSLPCPLKLNYTCWGDERHITEPSD